eukprot:COSAG06_NODE_6033_length_3143_cov_63.039750_2_plen_44_part_00
MMRFRCVFTHRIMQTELSFEGAPDSKLSHLHLDLDRDRFLIGN